MPPHLVGDLAGQARPAIEHGQHDALDLEPGVQHPGHQPQRAVQLRQPLERVELALDRDDDRVRRGQAVDRQEAQRGRAVQDDVLIGLPGRCQTRPQSRFPGEGTHQFHLGAGQINSRRGHPETLHSTVHHHLGERPRLVQAFVDRRAELGLVNAEAAGGIPLWVHVHQQHLPPKGGQARAQVYRGRGLPDSALLVHNRENAAHRLPTRREMRHSTGCSRFCQQQYALDPAEA